MCSTARDTARYLTTTHFQRVSCIWSLTHFTHLNLNDEILKENNHQPLPDLSTQFYLQSSCSRETFHKSLQRTDAFGTFWPFSSGNNFLDLHGLPTTRAKPSADSFSCKPSHLFWYTTPFHMLTLVMLNHCRMTNYCSSAQLYPVRQTEGGIFNYQERAQQHVTTTFKSSE